MGHDSHFLSRLDRVNRTETDFALALYRDHETVHWVLNRARIPDGADRVAIALSDEPDAAHIVVARDGGFVTCLGRGMTIGDRPRVRRAELDQLISQSREFRERWALLCEQDSLEWFFRRLRAAGPRIAREDFLPYVQIAPVLERSFTDLWMSSTASLEKRIRGVARELKKPHPDEEMLHDYWLDYYLAEHALVLASISPHVLEQFIANANVDPSKLSSVLWGLGRFGTLSGLTRVAWAAGRLGAVVREGLIGFLVGDDLSTILTGWAACAGLVLAGDSEIAARVEEIARVLLPIRKTTGFGVVYRNLIRHLNTAKQLHERYAREGVRAACDHWLLHKGDHVAADLPDDDPHRLAVAVAGSRSADVAALLPTGFEALVHGAPHLAYNARAEMLYPPRRWLDAIVEPWTPDATRRLVQMPMESLGESVPTRNAAVVGRNEPCPCGSGKKFKKCCGG